MTSTATELRPSRSPKLSLNWIAPAILVIGALVLVVNLSRSVPDRETVTIVNRTGAPVTVRTTGADRDGWLGLGTTDPKNVTTFAAVVDQGGVWRFSLMVGPTSIGEISRTEAQLRATGWRVTIPAHQADRLPVAFRS